MQTQLCLVRHGETDWNAQERIQGGSDIPLNEKGFEQARLAAAVLSREKWDAVVASPLSRALDTARTIAEAVGITHVTTDKRLVERHFGEAEGMNHHERRARFASSETISGAESWDAVGIRGIEAVKSLVETYRGKRVIVVAHGGLINSVLERISDGDLAPRKGRLQNGGMTLVSWDGGWSVEYVDRPPVVPTGDKRQTA